MKILLEPILVSIVAGLFILVIPKRFRKVIEFFSLITSVYLFVAGIKIFFAAPINIGYFYVDGLSRFIVPAIGLFGMLVTLYSMRSMASYKDISSYYAYILWTIGSSILAAISNNIIVLLISWGFLGFTLYALINISGPKAAAVSKKTFIIIGGSDSLMILGFGMMWLLTKSLNLSDMRIDIAAPTAFWSFLLVAAGAFAKAGAMPFHTWIPETAKEAPISVTAFLPASLDKLLGIYLLARLALNVFILNSFTYAILMVIGSVTILAAVMMALIQHDFKKLLGYHAVSQVGYMVLGIGTGNPIGIAGGLFHMLNHAIYKCCLFLSAGNVEYKTKTSELDNLGGLSKIMPITFLTTLIASAAISGVPPFNGFFSKWMIYQGLIEKGKSGGVLWIICLAAAMFGSGLTLASFIKLIHAIFLGQRADGKENSKKDEVSWQMWLPVSILAILCVIFGIFAYQIPLKFFIKPALGSEVLFTGEWHTLKATLLLFAGLATGLIIYFLGNFKSIRMSDPYIGGEPVGKDMRLSGTEFYNTIKEYGLLGVIYKKAEAGFFDIYEQGKALVFGVGGFFQYLHNGVLPTYLVWTLLGMMGLFLFFLK
ncbi:MAG: proton-conducting transporter membrane subunit [Candidatus Omnitrophota bacterium]|nr:proton-conducting transporter membrane subunit [Candidatus Omnitrophota bacterium]